MYFLIPGMSIYAAIGLNKLIHRNQGNRYIITGCKILAIILLLMFLVLSITTLMGYHQHKYWSAQKIGLLIESRSDPGDNIYLIQIANPIIYYSNRTNSWNPLATVRIEDIEKYHPLFIGYIESETIDSAWNRSNLIEYLYEQHYSALRVQDGIRVWAKSVDTIPLLYRNIQSIEFYNFSSYEKIEPKNEYKSFAIKYSENGNITLLQHPITDGIVVINYAVTVPANVSLIFGAGLDEKIWEKSDGVTFEIYLNASGNHSKLFSKHIDPKTNISDRKWQEFIIPLNEYAGEEIILGFATSPGPKRNVNYDWAYWINPEIVEQQ